MTFSRTRLSAVAMAVLFLGPSLRAGGSQLVTRDVYLMGTRARLLTYASVRDQGLATLERILSTLERTESELSTWQPDSAVSALNRRPPGLPWRSSAELCDALAAIYLWRQATGGAFDPAIGRLLDVWDVHAEGRVPSPPALAQARRISGLQLLEFDRPSCTLTRRAEVTLDVGAWGKGEALDRVARQVPDASWLIDLGGQISVRGLPPDGNPWRISIAHPLDRQRRWLEMELREGSLSTSAGSERDLVVDGRRVAHHLDPRTGEPASFTGSVSVWHQSGLVADILSTALYVMGPDDGVPWAESRGLAACYLVPVTKGAGVHVKTTTAFLRLMSKSNAHAAVSF